MRIRPQVLILTLILGAIGGGGLWLGQSEVAMATVVALAGAISKLVESD